MGDYKHTFLVVSVVFAAVAALSVVLRFQARRLAKQKLEADDWLALAALVCLTTSPENHRRKAEITGIRLGVDGDSSSWWVQ